MKTKFKTIVILFSILINYIIVHGQDQVFSKNSIKIGFGLGVSMGNNTNGG